MPKSEQLKIQRTIIRKGYYVIDKNTEILMHHGYYGNEFTLRVHDGQYWQTVKTTWNLQEILEIL